MLQNLTLGWNPIKEQDAFQLAGLRETLQYLSHKSPYYRRIFADRKVDVEAVRTMEYLQGLPVTTKKEMQENNYEFLCVPRAAVKEYTATSGTMGKPVSIALTESDLNRLAYNEHQSFVCADTSPCDIMQLMLTLDRQFMAGIAYYLGIRRTGAALVRTGPGLPAMQWQTIQNIGVNGIVGVPSFIVMLIEWAKDHGVNLNDMPVKKAICIGENLRNSNFALNALGNKIYEQWPIKLYSTYASTEMQTAFTECGAGMGGHHQPDLIIFEVVGESGEILKAGEPGEVLVTSLGVEGMPLLRYATGDICAYYDEPCSCGRLSRRLGPVLGRKQQMIKYKGTTLYPPAIFDILNEASFISEYVVEAYTGINGTDELRIHLHSLLTADDCEKHIKPIFQSRLRVFPQLQFHSATSIQQLQFPVSSRKQVKFIDSRICDKS